MFLNIGDDSNSEHVNMRKSFMITNVFCFATKTEYREHFWEIRLTFRPEIGLLGSARDALPPSPRSDIDHSAVRR
jgi:hypothetical protein